MRLVVGLGNPGLRYRFTRHNMGFMVIDKLSRDNSIRLGKREYNSFLGRGKISGEEVILMKPLTYMNLSGKPIAQIIAKEGLSLERMMVVCDDADLEFGTIRIRAKGSSGGHRGLESIIENLGSSEVPRLRIGIGRTRGAGLREHVLAPFRKKDYGLVSEIVDKAAQALDCWMRYGIQAAMSKFNA